MATDRLVLTPHGNVLYTLKTRYCGGTTDIIFEPLDFIIRLAALVPGLKLYAEYVENLP